MKVIAFNEDGSCGVMKDSLREVLEELISQEANILSYKYYYVDVKKPLELGLIDTTAV